MGPQTGAPYTPFTYILYNPRAHTSEPFKGTMLRAHVTTLSDRGEQEKGSLQGVPQRRVGLRGLRDFNESMTQRLPQTLNP